MKILVTGYSGFSGHKIATFLSFHGHDVYVIVRRTSLTDTHEAKCKNIKVIIADLNSTHLLPTFIDAVVHAAAASPTAGVFLKDYVDSNIIGTQNIVDYAKIAGAHTFIYLSSLSIYGDIASNVINPDTQINNPNIYGISKLMGELVVKDCILNFRSVSIRLPGVIGPKSVRNWLTNCREKARNNEPITIYNPQSLFNNAVHINDLSSFILKLLSSKWEGAHSVTVGAADAMPLINVVEIIINGSGGNNGPQIIFNPAKKNSFLICNSNALQFGYSPMSMHIMAATFAEEE
jgi:UDP-glucose 4-epimerase